MSKQAMKIPHNNIVTMFVLLSAFMIVLPAAHDAFARLSGDDGPFVIHVGSEMRGGDNFAVFYKVHAGAHSVKNVKVLVSSDNDTVDVTIDFISAGKYELVKIDVHAFSPYSIHAEIIDYQTK